MKNQLFRNSFSMFDDVSLSYRQTARSQIIAPSPYPHLLIFGYFVGPHPIPTITTTLSYLNPPLADISETVKREQFS